MHPNRATAKTGLNRSIHDAGWGLLLAMIIYKAEEAGRCVIAVEPRNTSRTCAHCGHTAAGNRHGAVFRCQACSHQTHADINAATNILRAGRAQQPSTAEGRNWPTTLLPDVGVRDYGSGIGGSRPGLG